MKILHIITSLRIGGAEKLLTELVPACNADGYHSEIALLDATPTPLTEVMERNGIKMHSLSKGVRSPYNPLSIIGIRKLLRQFDVVHTHNSSAQYFAALALTGMSKKPIMLTSEHNTHNSRRSMKLLRGLEKWMYSKYDRIVCVSFPVEKSLLAYMPHLSSKTVVIDNGIEFDLYANAKPTFEFKFLFPCKKIIIMVAAFRKQKDHLTMIKAMAKLPDEFALVFAGDGETRAECEALAQRLNVNNRIHFAGFRTDIPQLLKSADYIVLSSHYEGMSLSLIESMAVGKPFIASDVDGITNVAGEVAMLFNEGNSYDLASKIMQLDQSESLRTEVAKNCQDKAKEYNITHTINSYCRLYDTMYQP